MFRKHRLRSSWPLFSLQVQHANDSFLALTTDGINFLLSDQEICDVINQCQDPTEAADVIAQQVSLILSPSLQLLILEHQWVTEEADWARAQVPQVSEPLSQVLVFFLLEKINQTGKKKKREQMTTKKQKTTMKRDKSITNRHKTARNRNTEVTQNNNHKMTKQT